MFGSTRSRKTCMSTQLSVSCWQIQFHPTNILYVGVCCFTFVKWDRSGGQPTDGPTMFVSVSMESVSPVRRSNGRRPLGFSYRQLRAQSQEIHRAKTDQSWQFYWYHFVSATTGRLLTMKRRENPKILN